MITIHYHPHPLQMEFEVNLRGELRDGTVYSSKGQSFITIKRIELTSQDEVKVYTSPHRVNEWSHTFPLSPQEGEPFSITYDENGSLHLSGMRVILLPEEESQSQPIPTRIEYRRECTSSWVDRDDETFSCNIGGSLGLDLREWGLTALPGREALSLSVYRDGRIPLNHPPLPEIQKVEEGTKKDIDVIVHSVASGEQNKGFDTSIELFGKKVPAHFLKLKYIEEYGVLCHVSFMATSVKIEADALRVLSYPHEEGSPNEKETIQPFLHLGERLPVFISNKPEPDLLGLGE